MDRNRPLDELLHAAETAPLSRRSLLKRAVVLGVSAPTIAALLAACESDEDGEDTADEDEETTDPGSEAEDEEEPTEEEAEEEEPTEEEEEDPEEEDAPEEDEEDTEATGEGEGQYGGRLSVAAIGEPSTLDEHQTTAGLTAEIGYCMYETLVAYDENYESVPMLAESYEANDEGTVHTFALRQGVPFHNGDEMTADDVIASVERWGRISGVGQNIMDVTDEITAVDDYTVEWTTSTPYGTILVALSSNTQACVIYPQSVLEEASDDPLTEFIGTGPYRFVEHQPDVRILFERFEDYAAVEGGPNGYAGQKYAYADEIEFVPVPDESSRVNGMQAGDYHIAMQLGNDHYESLVDDETLRVEILPPSQWDVFFLNWESPMMGDELMRKAFQACLDHQPILEASRGGGDFVELDPSLMMEPTPWHSTVGEELYNIADPELAAQYLEEAGYDGTPVRFMATEEYSYMYNAAVVAVQQMEDAGFTVDFQIYDWATVLERRADPEAWDIFVTGHGFVPDPSQITYVGQMNVYPGWWSDPEALDLAEQFLSEVDLDTRLELWDQIQQRAYDTVPAVKTGDSSVIAVWSMDVGGFTQQLQRGVPYWNVWLEQ
ncbi:MAG: ABC transporter substrate-binding protein [Thermomicrobiaceae bacterium]